MNTTTNFCFHFPSKRAACNVHFQLQINQHVAFAARIKKTHHCI